MQSTLGERVIKKESFPHGNPIFIKTMLKTYGNGGLRKTASIKRVLLAIMLFLFFLISTIPELKVYVKGENPKLLRMLEMRIASNSTVIVRVSSTSLVWRFFKEHFYELDKSYWHSKVVDKIVKMLNLSNYRILRLGEEGSAFIAEVSFRLSDSRNYDENIGRLSIIDSFKEEGEYLSSVIINSEKKIYDCSNREKAWPQKFYFTHRLEWSNDNFSEAPENYEVFLKIPLRVVSNLPSGVAWRVYVNSEPVVEAVENSSIIYVNENDIVSVDSVINYKDDIRYVCYLPFLNVIYASTVSNRTFSFNYDIQYKISFNTTMNVDTINFNGLKYPVPFETWVYENTLVNASVTPALIQGSFTNYVFDGWVDEKGRKVEESFIVRGPMKLSAVWREEWNITNIAIVITVLTITFLILELRKRVSIKVVREKS